MPILTSYALANVAPRPHKRLYDQREAYLAELTEAYKGKRLGEGWGPAEDN
jgi:deoxyhypusine synthase